MAYAMPEDMEDQNLARMNMRLHTRIHLAGISTVTDSKPRGHKDGEERTTQAFHRIKVVDTTNFAEGNKMGDPQEKVKGARRKFGHYIHN